MKFSGFVFIFLTSVLVLPSFGQNRDLVDKIFNEPRGPRSTQLTLGTMEFFAALKTNPALMAERVSLQEAELALQSAKDLATDPADRRRIIDNIMKDPRSYQTDAMYTEAPRVETLVRIRSLHAYQFVTADEKLKLIAKAEEQVLTAQEEAFIAARRLGFFEKSARILRHGTSVLLVFDVAARVIVWNELEADPKISPIGNYIYHKLGK